jgi:HPr kinase/phosphorylase
MKAISVKNLLLHGGEKLLLKLIAGENGLWRNLKSTRVIFLHKINDLNNVGIEIPVLFISNEFIKSARNFNNLFRKLKDLKISMIVVKKDTASISELINWSNSRNTPLCSTTLVEEKFKELWKECLKFCSSNIKYTNGVLVDVNGVGILIKGKSSIGKSEVALELIIKGHRLVSDDVVEIFRDESGEIFGTAPDITSQYMEIRGLGIIDVSKVFGISSIRVRKKIELVIELAAKELHQIDRLGEKKMCSILGKKLPKLIIPVSPGRNIATLVEVAARLYLLERTGYKPLVDLKRNLKQRIKFEQI